MSRLQPGRARIERRYRLAIILGVVGAGPLVAATTVLHVIFNAPDVHVLVPGVAGLALVVVALLFMISVIRELPW